MKNTLYPSNSIISKRVLIIITLLIILTIIPLTLSQTQIRQIFYGKAWYTSQSAQTLCSDDNKVIIQIKFTNMEPYNYNTNMDILALDTQTNKSINIINIKGGETKTGEITTDKNTIESGTINITLTWSDKHSGIDYRTASYNALTCIDPTPTPTPLPSDTPSPEPTITLTPTEQASPTPTTEPTYTPIPTPTTTPSIIPTKCPTPGTVKNIKIICPYCTPSPNP